MSGAFSGGASFGVASLGSIPVRLNQSGVLFFGGRCALTAQYGGGRRTSFCGGGIHLDRCTHSLRCSSYSHIHRSGANATRVCANVRVKHARAYANVRANDARTACYRYDY